MSLQPTIAGRRLRPRHLWILAGLVVTILADRVASEDGVGIAILILAQVLPHVPGWLPGAARTNPVVVATFNALHHPLVPLALVGAAAAGLISPIWLVSAIAWLGHILIDWGLADGVRSVDGSRHGLRIGLVLPTRPARPSSPATAGAEQ